MYEYRPHRKRKWPYLVLLLLALGGYGYWAITKPLPKLAPLTGQKEIIISPAGSRLAWPKTQAAVGVLGSDVLETHGAQTPIATASTAKMVTCLVILREKPIVAGQKGPVVTLTQKDVDIYNQYYLKDGSLAPVKAGEKISEYQMLQAILLPSSNNMADSLAIWAYGSLKNYEAAANQFLAAHGLDQTHVGSDASGLSPTTKSSARDLVKIGELLMQNPVLAEIVNQKQATNFPVAKTIHNVNFLLGTANIVGIKTGNNDQVGGVFVSASKVKIGNETKTIVTAVTGSKTLYQALKESVPLIKSAQSNFSQISIVKAGQMVGSYQIPWGGKVSAVATQDLSAVAWKGSTTKATIHLDNVGFSSGRAGSIMLSGSNKAVSIELASRPAEPTIWWRLTHPL
jgi:D-alanyl-D-alanine carboxypeptidase (penicillin-binding protein 5/6)